MILFTTLKCPKCHKIKKFFNLEAIGIKEQILTDTNIDALTELAYYGLVEEARKSLPILVDNYGRAIKDFNEIVEIIVTEALNKITQTKDNVVQLKNKNIICEGDQCNLEL